MSEAAKEMTYDEQIVNVIKFILLTNDVTFGAKRDLISFLLGLSYSHDRDVKYANTEPTRYYGSNDSNALDALGKEGET